MRISTVLAVAIAAPVLLVVTACGNDPETSEPPSLRGTVVGKEFEPAVYGYNDVPIKKETCTKNRKSRKTGKKTCKKVNTGKTQLERYVIEGECYRLDIHVERTGNVIEDCNEAAFKVLTEDDPYDSGKDYSEVGQ